MNTLDKNTLDGEEIEAFNDAMKVCKNRMFYVFIIFIILILVSILQPRFLPAYWYSILNIKLILFFLLSIGLDYIINFNKFNIAYYCNINDDQSMTIFFLNQRGEKKDTTIDFNSIKKATLLSFGLKTRGRLIIETYSDKMSYKVIGEDIVYKLEPFLKKKYR